MPQPQFASSPAMVGYAPMPGAVSNMGVVMGIPVVMSSLPPAATLPAEVMYANGAACPEFDAMASHSTASAQPMVNPNSAFDALHFCCSSMPCSFVISLILLGLLIVLIYCASMYNSIPSGDFIRRGDYLPGIIIPAMFGFMIYLVNCITNLAQLSCCPLCIAPSASLKRGAFHTAAGATTPMGGTSGDVTHASNATAGHRASSSFCVMPAVFRSAYFTERASMDDVVAHFDRMRVAPVKLSIKVKCGHRVRRRKHSHYVVTYRYALTRFVLSKH